MLLSMTGFGESAEQFGSATAQVEIRSVNNRHLKLNCRLPEGYGSLEPKIDALVRKYVRRGTVQVNLQVQRQASAGDYLVNVQILEKYYNRLNELREKYDIETPIQPETLFELPGVISESVESTNTIEEEWPLIEVVMTQALDQMSRMRSEEGQAMSKDLHSNIGLIAEIVEKISDRAPVVVENYQNRLREKLSQLLQEFDVNVQAQDIVREVGIFADRADVSEEIVRLRSHFEQFDAVLNDTQSNGRKLEFLIQEMFRETNTIGSKANDAEIAKYVVEIKTIMERLREMVQNVE